VLILDHASIFHRCLTHLIINELHNEIYMLPSKLTYLRINHHNHKLSDLPLSLILDYGYNHKFSYLPNELIHLELRDLYDYTLPLLLDSIIY
jgi:hypothetical protein